MMDRSYPTFCAISFAMVALVAFVSRVESQGAPPPSVTVASVVSRQVTDTATFIGRVVAVDKVDIVARVSGFIEERNFTEGQIVKKDDLLFRIERETYKAAVDQQAANLAKAKATEVNASLQLKRNQELVKSQASTQATVDQLLAAEQGAGLAGAGSNKSWLY